MGKESHELGLLLKDGFLLGVEFSKYGGDVNCDGSGMFGSILQCACQAVGILQ